MADKSRMKVEEIDGVAVVTLLDQTIEDEQNVQRIGENLFTLARTIPPKKILLDFGKVDRFFSAFLQKLVTLQQQIGPERLVLACLSPTIRSWMKENRLDKYFRLADSRHEGIALLNEAR